MTGRVDGGGGLDTVAAEIGTDTTISATTLPTNFERLRIDLFNNAQVDLAPSASAPNGFVLSGNGSFTVRGDLTTNGPAFSEGPVSYLGPLGFENRGIITANLTDITQRAIDLSAGGFINDGTIIANGGDGVAIFGNVTNSGMVTASGTAMAIRSGAGVNSGSITGGTTGLDLSSGSVGNSGSITGGGVGVLAGYGATIENMAGGFISGGTAAIAFRASSDQPGYQAFVGNAGTITGDVDLRNPGQYESSPDVFVNDGGTLNGNLFLGGGDDVYVTDLGGGSGVTGTIDGGSGFDTAGYRVTSDASAIVALPPTFEALDYELAGGVALTLTAPAALPTSLSFGGTGKVDLTADLARTDNIILDLSGVSSVAIALGNGGNTNLDVISRGTLTYALGAQFGYGLFAAVNAGTARFENAGAIAASTAPGSYYPAIGVFGGDAVVNSGTIMLDGATGVQSAVSLVNSGSIVQVAGGAASNGVALVTNLDNSGVISVDAVAVSTGYNGGTITNSGTIESHTTTAIELPIYGRVTNLAGGVIRGAGYAISSGGGTTVRNDGMIVGDVRLGSDDPYRGGSTFVSNGTLTGNLQFGASGDLFLQLGDTTGVSGTIDGGTGIDTFGRSFGASATTQIGGTLPSNFEREVVDAHGMGTVVTITGPAGGTARDLYVTGDGGTVNQADVGGTVHLTSLGSLGGIGALVGAFTNQGAIGAVEGTSGTFANSGTIGSATLSGPAVRLTADNDIAVSNTGTIRNDDSGEAAVSIDSANGGRVSIANSGTITGGLGTTVANFTVAPDASPVTATVTLANTGTITSSATSGKALEVTDYTFNGNTSTIALTNSGRISATGAAGTGASLAIAGFGASAPSTISVVNTGTIEATGAARYTMFDSGSGTSVEYVAPAIGLFIQGGPATTATITNGATGTIAAPAGRSTALVASGVALNLDNVGTVTGGPGGQITAANGNASYYLAGAIQAYDTGDRIVNSGTIAGSIDLGAGDDRIENAGTIAGSVFLGDGNDAFVQHASAHLTGTVDGGAGTDGLIVDATGGGTVNGDQFVNFESFAQTGAGNVTYAGGFNYDTIALNGGSITVSPGTTLRTNGPVTITGSDADETVVNDGTIAGKVVLGGGDDSYTDGPGSQVGQIDGGAGSDTYVAALAGDRQGIGARTGFERLAVTGTGTLSLALDQSFDDVALTGTGIELRLAGFAVRGIDGSESAERVTLDGDVARVALGGGDDALNIGATTLAGSYDGGAGNDTLALTAAGPVTLAGTATGFETVTLPNGALTVTGTLGSANDAIGFGDGAQMLTIGNGGRLLGAIDLGAGSDSFRLAAGGSLQGSVSGGAGIDTATLELTRDLAIAGDTLRDFETLKTTGGKTLTLASGSSRYDRIDADGGLTVSAGATLSATQLQFGGGDDRLVIAGNFTGSADGGAGTNAVTLSGGSATAPIAFQNLGGFESLAISGGVATVGGSAELGSIDMTGGRLIGLAGSTIAARQIAVGSGATFGSAGTIVGDISVAGTLSPGASPGTMTVTGNVDLASGSTALFELASTASDTLIVSGGVSIASGATLTLTGDRPLTPGAALDLIVAGGGITGSFSTINQPSTILGFLRQAADRIQLFGQFDAAGFNPQITTTIRYVNAVLTGGQASAGLIAALPSLLTGGNATNGAAFARLNPEAYASATQIGLENGLALAKAGRAGASAGPATERGLYTFGQALGDWRPLDGSAAQGTARAKTRSYGALGGIGFGTADASLGGFVGYLDSRQRIADLAARTNANGVVGGLVGHVATAGFDLSALLAYDGSHANTQRALPGGSTATGRYHLHSWVGDAALGYAMPLGASWSLKPEAGLTYISTRRGSAAERDGGAFALDVLRRASHATFVDGSVTVRGGMATGSTVHPWLSAGVRHQLNGRATLATAGFIGADANLSVRGVRRQATLATAGAGLSIDLTPRLGLFASYNGEFGNEGTGNNLNGGLKLRF